MKNLIVRLKYLWRGWNEIGKPHLGMRVVYQGKNCVLTQGVANPYWNMSVIDSDEYIKRVHVSDFQLDTSLKGKWLTVKFHYDFYTQYWLQIDAYRMRFFSA